MEKTITFWDQCLEKLENPPPMLSPQQYGVQLRNANQELEEAIRTFRKTLAQIPIGAEIQNWLQSLDLTPQRIAEYESNILLLIDLKLLKITNENGELRTLNDLTVDEHQKIIEEIRCLPDLSIDKKESIVAAYITLSQHICNQTLRLIVQGEDPDFQRTIKKVVYYNTFIKFIQFLPDREALIAKLLYFGAPTMDKVLRLKVGQVHLKENMVKFEEFSVKYPKHVVKELKDYLSKKKKEDLVFVNMHGAQIERTHLNNCFNRASRNLPDNQRITPKMLLESDIARSVAGHSWLYAGESIQ